MIQKMVLGMMIGSMVSVASAQTSTTAASAQSTASANGAQPVQTLETTAKPATPSALSLKLTSESSLAQSDIEAHKSEAPVNSLNSLGASYKFADKSSLALHQYMMLITNRDKLTGAARDNQVDAWETSYTMLRFVKPTQLKLFGSNELTWEVRAYGPNSRAMQKANQLGMLRTEAYTEWMVTPKVGIGAYGSARFLLNSKNNPDAKKGSDAAYYRLIAAPSANYYFNDNLNAYYAYTFDGKSGEAQRGDWTMDQNNTGTHEVGANITVGKFGINPCLTSEVNHANHDATILTADSRVFAHENLGYNLNISATF